jgi:hypothetical protein
MARAREVAARRPSLVRPPLGIAHGIPGDPANRSAKLSGWLAADKTGGESKGICGRFSSPRLTWTAS